MSTRQQSELPTTPRRALSAPVATPSPKSLKNILTGSAQRVPRARTMTPTTPSHSTFVRGITPTPKGIMRSITRDSFSPRTMSFSGSVKRSRLNEDEDDQVRSSKSIRRAVSASPRRVPRISAILPNKGDVEDKTPSELLRQLSRSLVSNDAGSSRNVIVTPKRFLPSRSASTSKITSGKGKGVTTPRMITALQERRDMLTPSTSKIKFTADEPANLSSKKPLREESPMSILRALSRVPEIINEGRKRFRESIGILEKDITTKLKEDEALIANIEGQSTARKASQYHRRSTLGSIHDQVLGEMDEIMTPVTTRARRSSINIQFDSEDIVRYAETSALRNAAAFFPLSASDDGPTGVDGDISYIGENNDDNDDANVPVHSLEDRPSDFIGALDEGRDVGRHLDNNVDANIFAQGPQNDDLENVHIDFDDDSDDNAPLPLQSLSPLPDDVAGDQFERNNEVPGFITMDDASDDNIEATIPPQAPVRQKKLLRESLVNERLSASTVRKGKKKQPERISEAGIPVPSLPAALVKDIFATFSKSKVSKEVLSAVMEASHEFFEQVSDDLVVYAAHAGRKTIEDADVLTLMKRQRQIDERKTVVSLAQKFLPREISDEISGLPRKHQRRRRAGENSD